MPTSSSAKPSCSRSKTVISSSSKKILYPDRGSIANSGLAGKWPARPLDFFSGRNALLSSLSLFFGTLLKGSSALRSFRSNTYGFRHAIQRRSPAPLRRLLDHPHRAAARPLRTSPPRSLGLPRAPLFFHLARRQNPLQANRHRRPLGRSATCPHHAGVHVILRPPREASLPGPPLSGFLFRRSRPLDVFFLRSPDDHQRCRRQPAPHHQSVFSAPHSSDFRRSFRPRGLRYRLRGPRDFHWRLRHPPHFCRAVAAGVAGSSPLHRARRGLVALRTQRSLSRRPLRRSVPRPILDVCVAGGVSQHAGAGEMALAVRIEPHGGGD